MQLQDNSTLPISSESVSNAHNSLVKQHSPDEVLAFYGRFLNVAASTTDFAPIWKIWKEEKDKAFNPNIL
jgi:hypothetical protein